MKLVIIIKLDSFVMIMHQEVVMLLACPFLGEL